MLEDLKMLPVTLLENVLAKPMLSEEIVTVVKRDIMAFLIVKVRLIKLNLELLQEFVDSDQRNQTTLEFSWNSFGILLEFLQSSYGILLEFFWSSFRILFGIFFWNFSRILLLSSPLTKSKFRLEKLTNKKENANILGSLIHFLHFFLSEFCK